MMTRGKRRGRRVVVTAAGAALWARAGPRVMRVDAAPPPGCPSVGRAWDRTGPFAVTTAASGVGHTIFRPAVLGSLGCAQHPVIIWGNGTGGTPAVYGPL